MLQRVIVRLVSRKRGGVRQRLLMALVGISLLSIPAPAVALGGHPYAAIAPAALSGRSDTYACRLQSLAWAAVNQIPDPMTRIELWQGARQWHLLERCSAARAPHLHHTYRTGRIDMPAAGLVDR